MKHHRLERDGVNGLDDIIGGPLPSRRVLDELRPFLPDAARGMSPVVRAFISVDAALMAHGEALVALDRAEAALAAASTPKGEAGARRGRGLGSKRRASVVRRAREMRLGRLARVSAAHLLSAPVSGLDDIALKLAVVIASGEAGPPEAAVFPWFDLRLLLADLSTARQTSA